MILRFSHSLDVDRRQSFSADQLKSLIGVVRNALGPLLFRSSQPGVRIGDLPVEAIAEGTGRIIAAFESLPAKLFRPEQGILSYGNEHQRSTNLSVYDHFSETESVSWMSVDQWRKFQSFQPGTSALFLLSWTLTAGDFTSVAGASPVGAVRGDCIEDLASRANAILYEELQQHVAAGVIHPGKIPNILYVDYVKPDSPAWQACLLLNTRVVRRVRG